VAITNNERPVIRGLGNLVVGKYVRGHQAVGNLAFGQVGILQAQHGLQIPESESIGGQLRGIRIYTNRGQSAAAHADLAHALYLRKLLHDDSGSGVVHALRAVFVGGEAKDHDGRVGGIHFAIGGI
jgi:hypothetical protein